MNEDYKEQSKEELDALFDESTYALSEFVSAVRFSTGESHDDIVTLYSNTDEVSLCVSWSRDALLRLFRLKKREEIGSWPQR